MQGQDLSDRDRQLKEISVLFVDDDPLVRLQAQGILDGVLKALHLAPGGQEGLFAFALNRPDIIVTDVGMPGMDGLTLAQAIRGIKSDVPVVLLTSFDDPGLFRQAIALGVTDYLTKPLEPEALLDTLARTAATLHLRRELLRQTQLNELMLDAAPSPAVLVDLGPGRIATSNQLAAGLGYAAGQSCAGPLIPPDLLDELRQGGERLISAASSRQIAAHGRHWVLHWAPVGAGSILFTAVDITQRVEIEHFRDDVERITRHDLKTPLSAFTALPDLLLMGDNLTVQQREFIKVIRDAGMRMLGMINLSLDLFKMETGTYQLPAKQLDFAAVLRQAVSAAATVGRAQAVRMEAAFGLDPVPVHGDELLCLSMLENLLKNAIEASPRDAVVQVRLTATPGVDLVIRNRGEVPRDMRERFFEKYATSGKQGGTGLGTYSARMVARAHGGDVLLDAGEPGRTTVRVLLPAVC